MRPAGTRARILASPLLHFAAGGALLFGLHAVLRPPEARRIVVTPAFAQALRDDEARRLGRAPSEAEAGALVERFVDEEVMYREAKALGLDQGDLIVRRRLVQKMELLARDTASVVEPDEAALRGEMEAHAERYREPDRVSLRHVFVGRDRADAVGEAGRLLDELRRGVDAAGLGDPFLGGSTFTRRSPVELAAVLGGDLSKAVAALPVGAWAGPVGSTYGVHLVRVDERVPGGVPPLEGVKARVRQAVIDARQEEADRRSRQGLRARYVIERPVEGDAGMP